MQKYKKRTQKYLKKCSKMLAKHFKRYSKYTKPILGSVKKTWEEHQRAALIIACVSLVSGTALAIVFRDLPSTKTLQSTAFPVSTQIYDRQGQLLYEIFAETQRTPIELEELPPHVTQATIAIEDQSFYSHFGFSVQGIIRATKNTLFSDKLQGGSTITQQLVKTALLTPERTIQRKIKEAILTVGTELRYSKDEILEMYLNHVPYGGTAYGIEAAAQRYFNKPASELNLAEASLLAGLPQAPTTYSPFTYPEKAKARQKEVLRRMSEEGFISAQEADQAAQESLNVGLAATDIKAPHFVFYVKELLEEKYGIQKVEQGGLRVTTTLDLSLQEYAQSSVSAEIADLEPYRVGNGATLVTKPNTGEILAMVGSKDYFDQEEDGQVNLITRLRQPGSSIKPINYVTALQTKKLHPASIVLDIPTCFQVPGQPPYCPKNYDGSFHGPVSFRSALANSYNIPAVKVLAINGLETMIASASAMGISTFEDPSRYGLSLTLGGGEVTMLDMATAFGSLANQGIKVPLQPILKVSDYTGEVLEEYDPEKTREHLSFFFDESQENSNQLNYLNQGLKRVLYREPAYLMSDILSDNAARTPAFGPRSELYFPDHQVSVKTGTTNDLRDNWTIGYTPEYLVATWVGNNDNSPMNPYVVSGVTGAAPIFHDVMAHLLEGVEDTSQLRPSGVVEQAVCTLSGAPPNEATNPGCQTRTELFWEQRLPEYAAVQRKNIWINKDTGQPAFYGTETGEIEEVETDNLELQEHLVISDPFTQEFCLDCPPPQPENPEDEQENGEPSPSTIYPRVTVDMLTFSPEAYKEESYSGDTQ